MVDRSTDFTDDSSWIGGACPTGAEISSVELPAGADITAAVDRLVVAAVDVLLAGDAGGFGGVGAAATESDVHAVVAGVESLVDEESDLARSLYGLGNHRSVARRLVDWAWAAIIGLGPSGASSDLARLLPPVAVTGRIDQLGASLWTAWSGLGDVEPHPVHERKEALGRQVEAEALPDLVWLAASAAVSYSRFCAIGRGEADDGGARPRLDIPADLERLALDLPGGNRAWAPGTLSVERVPRYRIITGFDPDGWSVLRSADPVTAARFGPGISEGSLVIPLCLANVIRAVAGRHIDGAVGRLPGDDDSSAGDGSGPDPLLGRAWATVREALPVVLGSAYVFEPRPSVGAGLELHEP